MIILGLNAYHGDSSACIVIDGKLIAAVEEERFTRIKHWAGLPIESIRYCLEEAGVTLREVDHIAINRDPKANIMKKALYTLSKRPAFRLVKNRLMNAGKVRDIKTELCEKLNVKGESIKAVVHNVEHHVAHLASSFYVSPFEEAAVVSVDGFGDFVGAMWGMARDKSIVVKHKTFFPHSLGLFYLAFTQYLGFMNYGDEYKVMGLAPYGRPAEMEKMRKIVKLRDKGRFELDLDYFIHHSEGVTMSWDSGEPKIGKVYSEKLADTFGPAREREAPLTQQHKNIASSMQAMYEEAFFNVLDHVYAETRCPNLSLAGGCAMNSVANGKIFDESRFRELYIQSAAGDAGGSIGAAFYVWHQILDNSRSFVMDHAYLGPEFGNTDIGNRLKAESDALKRENCNIEKIEDEKVLCRKTAQAISEGKVVGWFQGRMEWGPRALGNRSIVCDPRRADMKDILNLKIKRRESFRPFAPSIIREAVSAWFETDYDVPFMLQVYQIRQEKRSLIPAVTHVNGSGRLQTVTASQNPRYYLLIKAFESMTGVPIVLNTSFNENEPVVCTPQEALNCFLRTKMDILVMGDWFIERSAS
jgi:carbamoyltransferase